MKTRLFPSALVVIMASCTQTTSDKQSAKMDSVHDTAAGSYQFINGYPTKETVQKAYDDADLNRAIQCYRFFYPSVSIMATWKGNLRAGMVANTVFGLLEGTPKQYVFTPNS